MATQIVETEVSPVLVVAALARELAPLARRSHAGVALIETGEGPRNASRVLRSWLENRSARAVINIGFAGSLSPLLQVGDIVVAREARSSTESFNASASPLFQVAERIQNARSGIALTVDEIICEAIAKRRLANNFAADEIVWVDMESAAIASVCSSLNVPFLIARSISDTLDEDLPLDFNRCRTGDGRVSARKVIGSLLVRPRALKGLIELQRRSETCAERLAAFITELLPQIT
jgi:adenosylhomocysteine nucleosidase